MLLSNILRLNNLIATYYYIIHWEYFFFFFFYSFYHDLLNYFTFPIVNFSCITSNILFVHWKTFIHLNWYVTQVNTHIILTQCYEEYQQQSTLDVYCGWQMRCVETWLSVLDIKVVVWSDNLPIKSISFFISLHFSLNVKLHDVCILGDGYLVDVTILAPFIIHSSTVFIYTWKYHISFSCILLKGKGGKITYPL